MTSPPLWAQIDNSKLSVGLRSGIKWLGQRIFSIAAEGISFKQLEHNVLGEFLAFLDPLNDAK
jgi:hypothetical protein